MTETLARPSTITAGPAADRHASELLPVAAQIAAQLAATANEREAADAPPRAEIDLLRQAGLLKAPIPVQLGGLGYTWGQIVRLVREIATGDASVAHLFAWHNLNLLGASLAGPQPVWEQLARETAAHGYHWGDVANNLDANVLLTRDGDGYRASGTKSFTTGASIGDRIIVFGSFEGAPQLFVIDGQREGVTFDRGAFDFIGARHTDSGNTTLDNVRVEAGELLGPPPGAVPPGAPLPPVVTLFVVIGQAMLSAVWVGAARGALLDAADYVRTTARPWLHSGLDRAADDPLVIERFGYLDSRLRGAEALVAQAADQNDVALAIGPALTERERGEVAATTYAARVLAGEVALEVTSAVFEVQGARSAHRRYGFDRRWRDVRTQTLHDPAYYKAREVGDLILNDRVPEPDGNKYR